MNELVKIKTQGAIIRSRQQWYEEGEKNSRYFFNLEKRNSNLKSINRLELNDNTITADPKKYSKWNETVLQKIIHENNHRRPYDILKLSPKYQQSKCWRFYKYE